MQETKRNRHHSVQGYLFLFYLDAPDAAGGPGMSMSLQPGFPAWLRTTPYPGILPYYLHAGGICHTGVTERFNGPAHGLKTHLHSLAV
ncbi:hypothetical protein, partial [Faecalibaculum rodentium]|uniref:hypothetical protein n=1 Tax=Faecalibaculum rodentium TaxID=1702221 RepID=UPI00263B2C23